MIRWMLFLGVTLLAMARLEVYPARIWNGLPRLGWMAGLMLPPDAGGFLGEFLAGMAESVAMAFAATVIASVLALPLGLLGARTLNRVWPARFAVRRSLDLLRGVDRLIWALIFVRAVGLGPFAGLLALVVPDIATLAKLYAETVEQSPRGPLEAVTAAGANWLERARFGILPQVLPVCLSQALYLFESNTRSATILGIVGAGGIGLQLSDRIRVNEWGQASAILLLILGVVTLIDWASRMARSRIQGAA
jgi:phosphonate transport system permease protein